MTREFLSNGQSVPVTVIKIEKGRVLNVISKEKRGYAGVQVGFGKIKNSKLKKRFNAIDVRHVSSLKHPECTTAISVTCV